jgi:precorrin-6B methylase 2
MTVQRHRSFRLCCVFCALLSGILWLLLSGGFLTSQTSAQEKTNAKPTNEAKKGDDRYEYRKEHDPNGIGKFYMGREIAMVMTFHGAPWLERPEREEEERLSELVKLLGLKPGMTAADVGAGSGVITLMMAHEVGETGKVLAIDIQQEMLDLLGDKLDRIGVKNVELVLGTEKSPQLKEASVDLALMVDVYHEFEFPYEMMLELSKSLKPGGRIAFVEYRREDPQVPIKLVHKMTEAQVKKEIGLPEFGLKWKETIGTLPRQHIVVFERTTKKP